MGKQEVPIQRQLLWTAFVAVLAIVVGVALWSRLRVQPRLGGWDAKPLEGLKSFGTVPEFTLIERSGRAVTLSELKGKVWVANFIYTNCPETCPIQSAQMKDLQKDFKAENDLRLVSITVDPARDDPKVLTEYAKRFEADPKRWLFLTGEKKAIYRLAQEGFRLGAAEIPDEKRPASGATHTHSPRFVLIDHRSEIRGYYTATDAEAMGRLRRDLQILLQGKE